jgi:hypothetical protein
MRLRPILLFLLLILAAMPARASDDVFTEGPVPVDATAKNAAAAREAARLDGQRRALRLLLQRLTPAAEWSQLPSPGDAAIANLIRDFEVVNEKSSGVRYLADYTYRFRPDPVRRLLRDANLAFAETPSKPVIVLPVLVRSNRPVLWDDPNPWREAWAGRKAVQGLVPVSVPVGDLADVQAIDAQQALAADTDALDRIAKRYGGGDVVVAQATDRSDGSELTVVQTTVARFGLAPMPAVTRTWRANPGESEADFLARVVDGAVQTVNEAWKKDNLLRFGQEATLAVVVPIGSLADWVAVRDRLAEIAAVRRSDLVSLSRQEAHLELHYVGDPAQLRLALAQRDLVLAEGTPYWTLQRRGANPQ